MILAPLQFFGTSPLSNDCWNSTFSTGAICSEYSFSILLGIRSGQMAFFGFSRFSKASTPFVVTNMSAIVGYGLFVMHELSESEIQQLIFS